MSRATRSAALALAAAALAGAPAAARAQEHGEIRTLLSTIEPGGATRGAVRAAAPATVYINTEGGIFTPGEPNDSTANVTSVPDLPVQLYPWEASDSDRAALLSCVKELFAPFNMVVTDEDPGTAPHLEAVVGGSPLDLGLDPTVAGVSPFLTNCGVIDNSIVFVFPGVVGEDQRRVCETVAQEVAHSFGLDHEYLCQDPMTYLTGCGEKSFLFEESICGEFVPRDCTCSRSQNSAKLLLDRLGRGDQPTMWLSQPSTGDLLSAGFPVQAVFTHAPASLQLYVDGVLADELSPEESDDAYQIVEFDTDDALRSGTHHLELRARFGEQDRKVTALVEVEGEPGEEVVGQGCSAGRGSGGLGGALLVGLLLAASAARRRLAAIGLVAAAASLTGCWTTVFGSPADDIESGCPGAGEVSPAIGVLWSPPGGTCTATLVAPNGFVTAAHCVAEAADGGDPIVIVLEGRQYIAGYTFVHPEWTPGAPADDVAALLATEEVSGVSPLALGPEEPAAGTEFKLIGHGAWQPDDPRDPERQAQVGSVGAVEERAFSYDEQADDGCLAGRGGGLVLAGGDESRLIGLHGEDQRVMRLDRYACWLACGAGPELLPAGLPGGCDCTRTDARPCGDCGVEFLDFASGAWTACQAAEDGTCGDGLTCAADGACVPSST